MRIPKLAVHQRPQFRLQGRHALRLRPRACRVVSNTSAFDGSFVWILFQHGSEHSSEKGFGVSVSRYWKAGNIDYKKVPEPAGIDLEQYRGTEVRVSVTK